MKIFPFFYTSGVVGNVKPYLLGYSEAGDKRQERDGCIHWREDARHTGQQGSCPLTPPPHTTISFKRRKFKYTTLMGPDCASRVCFKLIDQKIINKFSLLP